MKEYQFSYLLEKLLCTNPPGIVLKNIAATIQNANTRDLQHFLEILNTTHDMELQVKLITILAVYLVSNGTNADVIVSCKRLYDTVQDVLSRGLPMRTAKPLNFVSALLTVDDEDSKGKGLAVYARNMIRVSGCLSTMSHLFTGCMMYQDTWIALCQCLAEACRGSEVNQSYCSHLVPLCVKKCNQDNAEVVALLQSLLHKHDRNIQLFLESSGISMFTREMLQYDICMQLLNTVVKNSTNAIALLRETDIVHHLEDFLNAYGPYSQIGQWSTIILYHFDSRNKGPVEVTAANINNHESGMRREATTLTDKDTQGLDDTVHLFQNIMKEMANWQLQNEFKFKKPFNTVNDRNFSFKLNKCISQNEIPQFTYNNNHARTWLQQPRTYLARDGTTMLKTGNIEPDFDRDLTFSFLFDEQKPKKSFTMNEKQNSTGTKFLEAVRLTRQENVTSNRQMQYTISKNRKIDARIDMESSDLSEINNDLSITEFNPAFTSTPKNVRQTANSTKVSPSLHQPSSSYRPSSTSVGKTYPKNLRKIYKQKKSKDTVSPIKKIKNRSLSVRLFSAINDSCTTLVKSVKNIFSTKRIHKNEETVVAEHSVENTFCSYSFTNYMTRRDAVLDKERTRYQNTNIEEFSSGNSCKTCNDTAILKHKLANDKFLKMTLKKLKLGINLYGCDFKKISKTLWPRQRYMTQRILYNLYRKLILKE